MLRPLRLPAQRLRFLNRGAAVPHRGRGSEIFADVPDQRCGVAVEVERNGCL